LDKRTAFINNLKVKGINSVFHYVPLHSSPAGMKFGRANGDLSITSQFSERLVRLPLWVGLDTDIDRVINAVHAAC
jgi:dTDP-4-amino-4,6-dideoxygalactose transaminase